MLGRTLSTPDRRNDDGVAKEFFYQQSELKLLI